MNRNKGLLSYIPYGVKLEKAHEKMSKTKGIVALCLFAVLIFQAINRVNTGKYFTMSPEGTKFFFFVILVLVVGSLIFSLFYVGNFAHGWKVYVTLLVTLIAATLSLFIINAFSQLNLSQEKFLYFLVALLVNHALALIIHMIPLYLILSKYHSHKMKEHFGVKSEEDGDIKGLYFLLSPDYFYARLYKNHIKSPVYNKIESRPGSYETVQEVRLANIREQKNRLRYFVVFSNWINLMLTMLTVLYLLLIDLNVITNLSWDSFFFYLVLIRLVSRTFEVMYAFYKDIVRNKLVYYFRRCETGTIYDQNVINDWRDSAIRKPERISLAVHSYIELILLFAMFYFILVGTSFPPQCKMDERIAYQENNFIAHCVTVEEDKTDDEDIKQISLFDLLLYSASVTFFNVSFDVNDSFPLEWKVAHVLQVLASVVLVVLSLAAYLSFKDEMDQDDQDEFLLIKYWESEDEMGKKVRDQVKARRHGD